MRTEERLNELEIQFTHQENTISDLNEVILSQQKTIEALESRLLKLEFAIKNESISAVKEAAEESPPPHY